MAQFYHEIKLRHNIFKVFWIQQSADKHDNNNKLGVYLVNENTKVYGKLAHKYI